jgi:hypothetical protein
VKYNTITQVEGMREKRKDKVVEKDKKTSY